MTDVEKINVSSFIKFFWSSMDGMKVPTSMSCGAEAWQPRSVGITLSTMAYTWNRWRERVFRSDVIYYGSMFLSQLSPIIWYLTLPPSAQESRIFKISLSNTSCQSSSFLFIVSGCTVNPTWDSLSMS